MVGQMKLLLAAAALLISFSVAFSQAQGRMYVLESSVASIKVGKQYALSDKIDIPSGSSIRAVMPSGKTQTIRGPYSGPVADLAKGQPLNERVLSWITNFFETGGARESTPGTTRGMQPAPAGFSWTSVPVSSDGTICVVRGQRLQLTRQSGQAAARIAVVDVERSRKGDGHWERGSKTTAWPDAVEVREATYTFLIPDSPPRQVTLRVLNSAPQEEDILTELAARGCRHQFDVWMQAHTKG
jgi:hypothetical protein